MAKSFLLVFKLTKKKFLLVMRVEEKISHHNFPDIYITLATTIDAAIRI